MPKMSGTEAAQIIRKLGYKGLIVAVTGNVLPEDKDIILASGMDCVLPKPLSVDDLDRILKCTLL